MTGSDRRRWLFACWLLLLALGLTDRPLHAQESGASRDANPEVPVKRIKMYAENWKWTPKTIRVPQGTRLQIEIKNIEATHIFQLKEFGVKVRLDQDSTTTVEFLAERAGTFKWRCARPCGDGCPKMTGKLIVEAPEEGDATEE